MYVQIQISDTKINNDAYLYLVKIHYYDSQLSFIKCLQIPSRKLPVIYGFQVVCVMNQDCQHTAETLDIVLSVTCTLPSFSYWLTKEFSEKSKWNLKKGCRGAWSPNYSCAAGTKACKGRECSF